MKPKLAVKKTAKNVYKKSTQTKTTLIISGLVAMLGVTWLSIGLLMGVGKVTSEHYIQGVSDAVKNKIESAVASTSPQSSLQNSLAAYTSLDKNAYDQKMLSLANYPVTVTKTASTSTNIASTSTSTATIVHRLWPVKAVYPNDGALLPFNRIVAYYGNFYSTKMGALGEYPDQQMLDKLMSEVKKWQVADPATPVIPALHYIVETAQGAPGADGKYRLRMPDSQIDHALELAAKVHGIVFLDFQVALSNVQTELPIYEKYLKMPNVHVGIDPEFSMKTGAKPGTVIGTMSASDVNFAATYLAKLVKENNLPPKVLVVHRFTQNMLTNYSAIKPLPEVQIVVDMDGWGSGPRKINTYKQFVYAEPVQFTGFKLFYKNDFREPGSVMLTPQEVLKLTPQPSYIQYQ